MLMVVVEHKTLGLFPKDILTNMIGDSELFISERSISDILVDVHIKLFLYSLGFLTLFTVLARTSLNNKLKFLGLNLTFLCVFTDTAALFAIKYLHPAFSYVKAMAFVGAQILFALLVLYALFFLLIPLSRQTLSVKSSREGE